MEPLLSALAAIGFFGAFGAGVMYFTALYHFWKVLGIHHPALTVPGNESFLPRTTAQVAYKALTAVKDNELRGVTLHPSVLDAHMSAKRLLYVGMAFFLICLSGILLL